MSWPSTDRELEIEQELQALRKVAAAAEAVLRKFGDDYEGRFAPLREALEALPAEQST